MDIDFKTTNHRDGIDRGITFRNNGRVLIYLNQHESLQDIFDTITHETIHYCISEYDMVDIDDYQEHDLIFRLLWIDEYLFHPS